ncbi:hypothetical protein VNI00_009269 [Paramarasmius palmivorus]|uniref:Uncharacterized protein n=1 Tax=Paramarasmius palmivorus TaxID=297713 RepID=A0AAW0CS22_9AGAR
MASLCLCIYQCFNINPVTGVKCNFAVRKTSDKKRQEYLASKVLPVNDTTPSNPAPSSSAPQPLTIRLPAPARPPLASTQPSVPSSTPRTTVQLPLSTPGEPGECAIPHCKKARNINCPRIGCAKHCKESGGCNLPSHKGCNQPPSSSQAPPSPPPSQSCCYASHPAIGCTTRMRGIQGDVKVRSIEQPRI